MAFGAHGLATKMAIMAVFDAILDFKVFLDVSGVLRD